MDKNWTTIETLRQTRHDWLNKIQIIKGNLELNRIDRVKGIIDEIIVETQNEARLSSLNLPKFTEMLLTSNWNNGSFYCDYEIIDVFEGSTEMDGLMYRWTNDFFKILDKNLDPFF
ncbi:sporulation initiation phosphotransferase B [Bacillaceae bacterium OS4b]|nr:sporulation initiation phosphotransferase B [Bacillaceae bacterium OS4b]